MASVGKHLAPERVEPLPSFQATALVRSREEYDAMYKRSVEDPGGFWGDIAREFHWEQPWTEGQELSYNFDIRKGPIDVRWFAGGTTNICYNAVDRHVVAGKGDKVAFIWEPDDPKNAAKHVTYAQLQADVQRFAGVLKAKGVGKGDTVAIYMPMIPELAVAVLACARIGAIHSVVFGGFSAESLSSRIDDGKSRVVVTADVGQRGTKVIPLKATVDAAVGICMSKSGFAVESVIVAKCPNANPADKAVQAVTMTPGRDSWWEDEAAKAPAVCPVEWMDAEDPLFILYTSGSTGKPKGVLHSTGGYMVYATTTTKYTFDIHEDDVYWCTADVGWITGHSYLVYGPLCLGLTSVMFEGVPTWPDAGRCWDVVDRHGVTKFYTAPTAIRSLMACGDALVKKRNRSTLKLLGTVGEPINPEAWRWYSEVVGESRCPIVDTWWQTETGGHMITPLAGAWALKPGSATLPFFGVVPVILDPSTGKELPESGAVEGVLCLKKPWPSTIRTVYGDHKRMEEVYFSPYPGYYFTGDGCRRDEDGYYWITGRVDDVINVSGHRMGTAEVESALVQHPQCSEAAVVGYDHPIKGQGIYAYVTLTAGANYDEATRKELVATVRSEIRPIATPDVIHWAPGLPKTRSGKIMRRILRKIAAHEEDGLGDTSTLADPSVVEALIKNRP